jgi:tetratricopeptide (TPR) repeat protein
MLLCVPSAADTVDGVETRFPSMYENDSLRAQVLTGVRLTVNDEFAAAESLFIGLAGTHKESPIGPMFVAAAIHAQMLDEESPSRRYEFDRWINETQRRTKNWRNAEPDNGEPEFILGAAEGYSAVFEARWGGWFAALKTGLRSKNHCDDALRKDSSLVDALIGIGNFNYWKSAKTEFINWLPIVTDDREKGLVQLRRVITDGVFSKAAARASLAWALINEGDYTNALAHADTLRAEYPGGGSPLWIAGYACFGLYRWEDALEHYTELEHRINARGAGNYYNLIECAYYQAHCYQGLGKWREALAACHKALAYPIQPDIEERQKDKLRELRSLQKTLKELVTGTAATEQNTQ